MYLLFKSQYIPPSGSTSLIEPWLNEFGTEEQNFEARFLELVLSSCFYNIILHLYLNIESTYIQLNKLFEGKHKQGYSGYTY